MVYEDNKDKYFNDNFSLLHDNRIFHFSRNPLNPSEERKGYPNFRPKDAIGCLNNLLTMPKYRALFGLYSLFKITDYLIFIVFLFTTVEVVFGDLAAASYKLIILLAVIGIELFYDVMGTLTKLWFIERLKFFIAIALYIVYTILFVANEVSLWKWILLAIRFGAFILELILDIAIDMEIHNDIMEENSSYDFLRVYRTTKLKEIGANHYLGSHSSLLFETVYRKPTNRDIPYKSLQWFLWFMFIVIAYLNLLPLSLVIVPVGVFFGVLSKIFRWNNFQRGYIKELFAI